MKRASLRQGFTMIEVMLVLLIMVSIAALGVVAYSGMQDRANVGIAEARVHELAKAIELYNVTVGNYPTTDEGLEALHTCPASVSNPDKWRQLLRTIPVDPWRNEFHYQYPSSQNDSGFDVWSSGPDGISGTDDDITNWSQ